MFGLCLVGILGALLQMSLLLSRLLGPRLVNYSSSPELGLRLVLISPLNLYPAASPPHPPALDPLWTPPEPQDGALAAHHPGPLCKACEEKTAKKKRMVRAGDTEKGTSMERAMSISSFCVTPPLHPFLLLFLPRNLPHGIQHHMS